MHALNDKLSPLIRCHFGGGATAKPPVPPKPPQPTDASKVVNDRNAAARRRNGYGYQDTILTSGMGITNPSRPKTLLGE